MCISCLILQLPVNDLIDTVREIEASLGGQSSLSQHMVNLKKIIWQKTQYMYCSAVYPGTDWQYVEWW